MKKILVVDDNDQNLYMIEVLLNSHNYKVLQAKNGQKALEVAHQDIPDLIISDILMPVMDGFTLCRKWKEDEVLKKIPFIFYTATYTDPKDEEYSLSIGADKYIRKPMDPDLFLELVLSVVNESQQTQVPVRECLIKDEEEGYKLYSTRLIKKLEKKMFDLEEVEQSLRESEKKFRGVFENAHIGIVLASKKGEIKEFNEEFRKILGYDSKELKGMNFSEFTHPEDLKQEYQYFNKFIEGSLNNYRMQKRYITKSGDINWIEITISAIRKSNGDIKQFIGMVLDINEQKKFEAQQRQLERQLRQAQKMESIGNLAGGIAHDFNNILSAIIGYTELSLADVEKGTIIEENLEKIYSAGKRATDLVKQILTFARKTDEKIKPVRPDKIGEEVLKLLSSATPTTIDIQSNFETSSSVMGNPTQLHQVFMNLCTNAIQSMEDTGGTLKVSLSEGTIAPESINAIDASPGKYLIIEISDTGKGILQENIESIFDPYFTTKDPTSGTGLGLSTVHGIVKSYGGKITVESDVNKGSVFSIYLPIVTQQDKNKSRQAEAIPKGNERILFIDDELSLVEVGGLILTRLGYEVTTETDSLEALEIFRSNPDAFDLVITDMTMPIMTGEKLTTELIKIRSDIPVILLTGYHKKISKDQTFEPGVKAFAQKPIMLSHLAKIVRQVLDESNKNLK